VLTYLVKKERKRKRKRKKREKKRGRKKRGRKIERFYHQYISWVSSPGARDYVSFLVSATRILYVNRAILLLS
jgi:hypothetical protein